MLRYPGKLVKKAERVMGGEQYAKKREALFNSQVF
jgi:hypothetical protein